MPTFPQCASCQGSGEAASDHGPYDCPDCGGTGRLPVRATLVEWRARDLERTASEGRPLAAEDARWLLAELRVARAALTEVVALAHDIEDAERIAQRVRFTANRALGLYEPVEPSSESRAATGGRDERC